MKVLTKKGMVKEDVDRVRRIYSDGVNIPVVNGIFSDPITNSRVHLDKGTSPALSSFCIGS